MTSTNERNENVNCFANQCQNSFTYLVAFIYCFKLDFEQMNILISDFFRMTGIALAVMVALRPKTNKCAIHFTLKTHLMGFSITIKLYNTYGFFNPLPH